MIKRPLRPSFGYTEREQLLQAMGGARYRASLYGGACGYGSLRHQLCADMQKATDALAADLRGDPFYFALKVTPSTQRPVQPFRVLSETLGRELRLVAAAIVAGGRA